MTLNIILGIEGLWQLIALLSLFFSLYVIPIILCVKRARKFNRNEVAWGILGLLFSFIAVFFVYQLRAENTKVEVVPETNGDKRIEQQTKRPTAITVICVLGFIGVAFSIPEIFSDFAEGIENWYQLFSVFSIIIGFVCMVGLWHMKKWGAYTYAGFVGLNQIVFLTMEVWDIMTLIIPAIVVCISFTYIKKMD